MEADELKVTEGLKFNPSVTFIYGSRCANELDTPDNFHDKSRMTDIFISYARQDLECAKFIERILSEQGWEVWRDEKRLVAGVRFQNQILKAVRGTPCLIALWSRSSISSGWVRKEAALAFGEETIVPLSIDGTLPPVRHRSVQWLDMRGWEDIVDIDTDTEADEALEKLANAVREKLNENTLKEMLYRYLVQHENIWCWPTNIRRDASFWLRFEPIADHGVAVIRKALDALAEEGYILGRADGAYGYF